MLLPEEPMLGTTGIPVGDGKRALETRRAWDCILGLLSRLCDVTFPRLMISFVIHANYLVGLLQSFTVGLA